MPHNLRFLIHPKVQDELHSTYQSDTSINVTHELSNHAQTHLSAVMFGGGTAIAVRWRGDLLGHGGTFLL